MTYQIFYTSDGLPSCANQLETGKTVWSEGAEPYPDTEAFLEWCNQEGINLYAVNPEHIFPHVESGVWGHAG